MKGVGACCAPAIDVCESIRQSERIVGMKRGFRRAERTLFAVLAVFVLMIQNVLPVYADTADESADSGYTVSEEGSSYSLDYFDRIAVNALRGVLTVRSGDDFSISFPSGWKETPVFSVQDDILVVSGRKSEDGREKAGDGSAVVLGEDEPAGAGTGQTARPETEAASESGAGEGEIPETVITIPAGVGLDTLRIAMEEGDLIMAGITAGSVTIQSGGGSMVMRDNSLGTVDVYSDSGSISMEGSSFGSLNIGMSSGDVSVKSAEGLSRCRMEVKTGDGEITYNGASQGMQYLQPGNGKKFLTIQIGAGNIDISE